MNNVDLDINLFNDLKYSLLMHGEVNTNEQFDPHMYADMNRVVTIGIGFNIEEIDKIQYICALKLGVLKSISDIYNSNGDFSSYLNDTNMLDAINDIACAVLTCIQRVKLNSIYGIQAKDKQISGIDTDSISFEELEHSFTNSSQQPIINSEHRRNQNRQIPANTAVSHRRALMLELSVNKAIEDTINNLNETKYKNNKLNIFKFTLNKKEAVVIFSIISISFYRGLVKSLTSGHSRNIFKSSFPQYSKLILAFLGNYYQMPKKFDKYNDPKEYFSNAISTNNSRFLTWFGIRYYIDLVSATHNNQYKLFVKRRIHEAALFELIERDVDGNIDIFNCSLDIFNYLNIDMLVVHPSNYPLSGYDSGYSYLKFMKSHSYCQYVDIVAQDDNKIKLSQSDEHKCFFNTTTKISDVSDLLQNNSKINQNDYVQGVLDFASYNNILQPFLIYMNEKFSKGIVDVDYKLDEIFVTNNSNYKNFRNSLESKLKENEMENKVEILVISLMEENQHQRFYDILSSYNNVCITFYVLKHKSHTLTVENLTETNFRIILYNKTSEINAVNISGEYIFEKEESNYFYKNKDNDKLEAEYILNENKLIITYDKTTMVTLLNYIPSNNHCGIILSNQEAMYPDSKAVSQSGEINVKVNFLASSIFDFSSIDKAKYYLHNVETGEIIDTFIESQEDTASASFKLNMKTDMPSNTKCVFSFFYEDLCSLRSANFLSHDMCLINHANREAKQVEVTAKINSKEIPQGIVIGMELVSPNSENLPEKSDFMSTEYKVRAITKNVEDSSHIKWCYAVLTDSEYRGRVIVSKVSEPILQTGEEITFKPEDILSDSSKKKLEKKDASECIYIFAYIKSPAFYNSYGITHVLLGTKKLFQKIKPIVIIDAGHGGGDPGAHYYNIKESDATYILSRKLENILKDKYNVKLTRIDKGSYVKIDSTDTKKHDVGENKIDRVQHSINALNSMQKNYEHIPNIAEYIVFISLHLNAADNKPSANGFECLYCNSHKYAKVTKNILKSYYKKLGILASKKSDFKIKLRECKSMELPVIRDTVVPSFIVEFGFLSNDADRKKMVENNYDNIYINSCLDCLDETLDEYFNNL